MTQIIIINDIKEEIARKVVEQASAGYSKAAQGEWFVIDGASVMHRDETAQWNPWHDGATVISVDDLVGLYGGADAEHADFDPGEDVDSAVQFALDYVPDSYDSADYAARFPTE